LHLGPEAAGTVPAEAAVKELAPAKAQRREDVLEIGRGARGRAEGRRIERAASSGEQRKTDEAAADLEATRADVFVRNAVTCEVQDRPEQKRRQPRAAGGAGGGARRDVKGDDQVVGKPSIARRARSISSSSRATSSSLPSR
jgi:hypothetical protein